MKRENHFQSELIEKLEEIYSDAYIFKTSQYAPQGFPDITIIHESGLWAFLECKRDESSHRQPNQEWYVHELSHSGFCAFVWPENEVEVLKDLWEYFERS